MSNAILTNPATIPISPITHPIGPKANNDTLVNIEDTPFAIELAPPTI